MPLPYIIEITSKSSGQIKGSSQMFGKDDVILAYSFDHCVSVSKDQTDDGASGLRIHHPLTIYKEMDQASPVLNQHLTAGALLSNVVLRFFKTDATGKEVNYHTIILDDAIITNISPEMKLAFLKENEPYRHMEYVSFSYKTIRWIDELNSKETMDTTRLLEETEEGVNINAIGAFPPVVDSVGDLNVMFVDKDSMEILPGIKTQITYPDGKFKEMLSSRSGSIRLSGVEKGSYSLSGFNKKVPNAWRGNSYSLAKMDQPNAKSFSMIKPASKPGKQERHHSKFKHICKIKEHKVKKGELFSDVAKSNGFSFEELAFFNWGTKDKNKFPEQIKMRFDCGELAPSGEEYFLESGIIYIPEPVEKSGLATDTQHVAYLKKAGQRNLKVTVMTSSRHPIPNVEATLTLGDNSTYKAQSDEEGIAEFKGIPSELEGKVTYEDEDDLIAKSFAANIHGAVQDTDIDYMTGLLQSAVDYKTVQKAYKTNHQADIGENILSAFSNEEEKDIIQFLLLKTRLIEDSNITFHEDTGKA